MRDGPAAPNKARSQGETRTFAPLHQHTPIGQPSSRTTATTKWWNQMNQITQFLRQPSSNHTSKYPPSCHLINPMVKALSLSEKRHRRQIAWSNTVAPSEKTLPKESHRECRSRCRQGSTIKKDQLIWFSSIIIEDGDKGSTWIIQPVGQSTLSIPSNQISIKCAPLTKQLNNSIGAQF